MNKIVTFITLFLMVACKGVFFPVNIESSESIALKIGNKYRFHKITDYQDYYFTREIVGDTIINSKKYFKIESDGYYDEFRLVRYENGILYSHWYELGVFVDREIFNYNQSVGDTVSSHFYRGIIRSKDKAVVLDNMQTVFIVEPFSSKIDTLKFSKKFILIAKYYSLPLNSEELVGAISNGIKYGIID